MLLLFGQDNLELDKQFLIQQSKNFKISKTVYKLLSAESEYFVGGKIFY